MLGKKKPIKLGYAALTDVSTDDKFYDLGHKQE